METTTMEIMDVTDVQDQMETTTMETPEIMDVTDVLDPMEITTDVLDQALQTAVMDVLDQALQTDVMDVLDQALPMAVLDQALTMEMEDVTRLMATMETVLIGLSEMDLTVATDLEPAEILVAAPLL